MNLILILVTWCLCCIQISNSKKVRVIPDDELYPYMIEKGVASVFPYFTLDHLWYEQTGDDEVRIGGYGENIKSFDHSLPIQLDIRTQFLYQSSWIEGPIRLLVPNLCPEFVNPSRMWYNISKLWTNCPPQKGDKWLVEPQIIDVVFAAPPSLSTGRWKAHLLFTQGLFGASHKFGVTFQLDLIEAV